ncbi:MAG: hypothetical protein AAGC88_12725 [Bacteroidota bacterium]
MKTTIAVIALFFAISTSKAEVIKRGKTEIVMFNMDEDQVQILFKN